MEESVDVKALRARFTAPASSSCQDSESPKSGRPVLLIPFSPITDTNPTLLHRRPHTAAGPARSTPPSAPGSSRATPPSARGPSIATPPTAPGPSRATPPSAQGPSIATPPTAPGPSRATLPTALKLPRATPPVASVPKFQPGPLRPPTPSVDSNKVRQTGELLQSMMLRHQRPPGPGLSPVPTLFPVPSPSAPHIRASSTHVGARALPRQRSTDDVPPLRRPLPAMAPTLPKPKRPPQVNIEQWKSLKGAPPRPAPTGPRCTSVSPLPGVPVPAPTGPPRVPQRDNKPGRLPRQTTTVDIEDDQEPYDDIGSLEINDSRSDSQSKEENEEIYEDIDANQMEQIQMASEKDKVEVPEVKLNKKEVRRLQEQERKEQQEKQRKEEQLRKNFQLQLPVEVLHTASVRQDWSGASKLDLSVRQGDKVDIIRVKNNPEGKWLARSRSGNYGYISNTCVDIDYEAIRRKATLIRRVEHYDGELPPPPPDPPGFTQRSHVHDSHVHDSHVHNSDPDADDNYDDVDFPPPPIELNIDPKIEKELKKKYKFDGPLKVLQTMMVDPNALLKKPGPKDLNVSCGDILDILQLHSKKALCRDRFGKFGYVNKSHLLPLEGDIYDDVQYPSDVYDNDSADY